MTDRNYKLTRPKGERVEADVRRTRAFGDYDKTAKEAQRRAAAYGRARGNQ